MEDKTTLLKSFDEKKFKKISDSRINWLNSGEDMIINENYKTNEIAREIRPSNIIVNVKEIKDEITNYKTIVLNNIKENELPLFRAGQKIAVDVNINGAKYTRPYSLTCSPLQSLSGEYSITVKNDEEDIVANYLFNNLTEGDKLSISSPFGVFYWESMRDEENVIAIVSDDGIMPVYSMIRSIIDGVDNYKLTVFYSEKYEKDLVFKKKLLEYNEVSNKVKVNIVLSEEKKAGYMSAFVSLDKIKKEYDPGNTSIFIAGNEGLLKYLDNELKDLSIPKKFIRYDSFLPRCNIRKVVKYNLTLYIKDEKYEIPCYNNKTIMKAIEESDIYLPSKCQNGSCGFCHSELLKGEVKIVNDKRTMADKKYNYIHPCATYPKSDIEIIVR